MKTPLELWGGHECTLNRVGDAFRDQTRLSGHHDRLDDLNRFADLGLKALRYPVLWERADPMGRGALDWSWTDPRFERIRTLGMRPIAGLLHHGSGPSSTHLLDEAFAPNFAVYAQAAAERYSWVGDWTPINEPLTTARFCALYGHWYPHAAGERPFWLALLNQIDATRLAMAQIRQIRSDARLIQTEDLGRTYATPALAHQAEFDNARRWMTWDLLEGRVTPEHQLWSRLEGLGFADRLSAIADAPCPPDVIGVNHYLTSDRLLDEQTGGYPPDRIGGNGDVPFVDVEAIRVLMPAPAGLEGAMDEAWARYGRTLAVTESHNGCTREEQVRWLRQGWDTAHRLRGRGVDVEAVTAWALLGGHDWNSLLTRQGDHYEVGAFDVRSEPPRPTALAAELKRLAQGGDMQPGTGGAGWWERDIRLQFKPVFQASNAAAPRFERRTADIDPSPLLILGATEPLARALALACDWRGIDYRLTRRSELDLGDEARMDRALDAIRPWAVIDASDWARMDNAGSWAAERVAADAEDTMRLAKTCALRGISMVGFSSELGFDERMDRPSVGSDSPMPLGACAVRTAQTERELIDLNAHALIVRTAGLCLALDLNEFAVQTVQRLETGMHFAVRDDVVLPATYITDFTNALLDLLLDGEAGLRCWPTLVRYPGRRDQLA